MRLYIENILRTWNYGSVIVPNTYIHIIRKYNLGRHTKPKANDVAC